MKKLFITVGITALILIANGCKFLSYSTLNPTVKNEKLLPMLTPVFDDLSFGTSGYNGGDVGYYNGGGTTSRTAWVNEMNTIFERDIRNNICDERNNEIKGTIKCKATYGKPKLFDYAGVYFSSFFLFVGNIFFGIPVSSSKYELQIEVTISDNNNKLIKRYTSDVHKQKAYAGIYYYKFSNAMSKCARLVFTECMIDIKRQISRDYNMLNDALK
jgi:hypothetical protein